MTGDVSERDFPIAELVDIGKRYVMGEDIVVDALKNVSAQILPGDFFVIMGPSGSGKSTLLNLLGCLDRPTTGEYILGGEDVSELEDDDLSAIRGQRIGFIFQSFNLIQSLTIVENIEVPLFYQGVDPLVSREKAAKLASRLGLGHRLSHRPTELSGGQQQRVAIARSLSNDPLILLADEPTGNLDSVTAGEILTLLHELNEEGRTIVLVTHDERYVNECRAVLRLKDGFVDSFVRRRPPASEAAWKLAVDRRHRA